jgi:hypothetical protein
MFDDLLALVCGSSIDDDVLDGRVILPENGLDGLLQKGGLVI